MKIAKSPEPLDEASGTFHTLWCSNCREFTPMRFTLLENDHLEERCQACGTAIEMEFTAGLWTPLPMVDFFERYTRGLIESKIREIEHRGMIQITAAHIEKLRAIASDPDLLRRFNAALADDDLGGAR